MCLLEKIISKTITSKKDVFKMLFAKFVLN